MKLPSVDQKFIDDFFAAIGPYEPAFQHIGFSYLAVKFGAAFSIIRGRIFMNTSSPPAQPQHFQSSNVRAGNYALKELGFDVRGLINQLLNPRNAARRPELHACSRWTLRHIL